MGIPNLSKPRWPLINRAAQSVLKELGFPAPPITLDRYITRRNWEIHNLELGGIDGGMVKITYRDQTSFFILIANDRDKDSPYDAETIRRRRLFTLAHELGHILLHGSFIADSRSMTHLPEDTEKIIEIEANWFASRLLMPNYAFNNVVDLLPEQLAEKCGVNITPANKRIKNLGSNIKTSLIQSARLDKWPSYIDDFPMPEWRRNDKWTSYDEAAASSQILYICRACGLLHNERTLIGMGRYCEECDGELLKVK